MIIASAAVQLLRSWDDVECASATDQRQQPDIAIRHTN